MSSERKIRASQLNGAKSRGAVTPAGRLKSSANSARHHLLSETILLDNERPEAFADLIAGLTREFNPQTETQRALVETMAVSRWRQTRVGAVERATLQSAMEAIDPDTVEPATRAARAFRSLADDSRTLDLLGRYESRFDRQFARALNLLIKLDPLRRTGLPACPSAEGAPSLCGAQSPAPQEDSCQTNPSGEGPDASSTVCADAETVVRGPHNHFCQTNLIPNPDSVEGSRESGAQPLAPPDVTAMGRSPTLPLAGAGAAAAVTQTAAQPTATLRLPRPFPEQSDIVSTQSPICSAFWTAATASPAPGTSTSALRRSRRPPKISNLTGKSHQLAALTHHPSPKTA
jgi:hypothetical protein